MGLDEGTGKGTMVFIKNVVYHHYNISTNDLEYDYQKTTSSTSSRYYTTIAQPSSDHASSSLASGKDAAAFKSSNLMKFNLPQ